MTSPPQQLAQLQLLLTERCNLRCTHCAVPEEDSPADHELTTAQWNTFISSVLASGVRRIVLSGGEALLRKDCLQIAAHALTEGAESLIIVSNGTVLQRSTVEELARLQALWPNLRFHVSIDGASAPTHDTIRGPGTFQRTLAGLTRLRDAGGRIAGVHTVINRANISELDALVELVRHWSAQTWTVFPVAALGRGQELDELRLTEPQWRTVLEFLSSDHLSDIDIGLMGPTLLDEWRSVDLVPTVRASHSPQACVGPDGAVFACPPLREHTTGWATQVGATSDWKSIDQLLRQLINPVCPTCKFRPLCTGVYPGAPFSPAPAPFRHPRGTRQLTLHVCKPSEAPHD
jgi:radical SAM protein with 4Fe4S-binding SPASM domain